MLGDQMLQRIEFVHINSFLHRDIKPDNFLMGNGKNSHVLYIIDFGLSKRFIDPKTGEHIPYRDGKSLTGTARYASLNTHIGQEQSRRDDIESIAFVMVYFLKGELPWQGVAGANKDEKYERIKEKKIETSITDLSKGLPSQMLKFFEVIRNIGFEDSPDYISLRTLFAEMFTNKKYENDFEYDWVLKANCISKTRYHCLTSKKKEQNYIKEKSNQKPQTNKKLLKKEKNLGRSKAPIEDREIHQKHWGGNRGKHNKTYENINTKEKGYNQGRNKEYQYKREEDIHQDNYRQNRNRNNYKNNKNPKFQEEKKILKEPERGEECKKPVISDVRKKENKAIFAHQLKSIQKTLIQDQNTNKSFSKAYGNFEKNSKNVPKSKILSKKD